MKKYKLIILILSCNDNNKKTKDYLNLKESIKKTWYNNIDEDVLILFYSGDNDVFEINNNEIKLPCDDRDCITKTHMAFQFIFDNYDFDYLYRSNLGAYIVIDNIIQFIIDKPKNNYYCGIYGVCSNNKSISYCSGSGYFLSKDVVDVVIKNTKLFNYNLIDDVAMGDVLYKCGIKISNGAKRLNICDNRIFYQTDNEIINNINEYLDIYEIININKIYHIRLRSVCRKIDIDRMMDISNRLCR